MIFTISLTLKADGQDTFHKVWRAAIGFKNATHVLNRLFFRRYFTIDIYHSTQENNKYSRFKVRSGAVEAGTHEILRDANKIKVFNIRDLGNFKEPVLPEPN